MVCPLPFLLLLFYSFTFLSFYLFTLLPFKNINQAKYHVLVKLSFFVSFALLLPVGQWVYDKSRVLPLSAFKSNHSHLFWRGVGGEAFSLFWRGGGGEAH